MRDGKLLGRLEPTGLRPKFYERIQQAGLKLGPETFGYGRPR